MVVGWNGHVLSRCDSIVTEALNNYFGVSLTTDRHFVTKAGQNDIRPSASMKTKRITQKASNLPFVDI